MSILLSTWLKQPLSSASFPLIASLVDLSAKIVSRLHEFSFKPSDIPEAFRSLSTRLGLLPAALQRITV
jgi:hypothetical protein